MDMKPTVRRWWDRFLDEDIDSLPYGIRQGGDRRPIPEERVREPIDLAMSPREQASRWTLRAPAETLETAVSTVFGILKRNVQKPHGPTEADDWLKNHPDRAFRFTPTPAPRTHAAEGIFSRLSKQWLKHAIFHPLDKRGAAIEGRIEHRNADGTRPFRRANRPEDLVAA